MSLRATRVLAGVATGLLLAGCSGAPAQPAPAPVPDAVLARPAADDAACRRHEWTSELLRREADTYASMPVPPVRVALVLAATWEFYAKSGAQEPALLAAMNEVAAAIGDLDAQGRAKVPQGGTLMDPVQLDVARTLAAVDAVDEACAG
jgi:hypothetical protein